MTRRNSPLRNQWRCRLASMLVLLLALLANTAPSQITRIWDGGGGDNNWSTSGNWSSNDVPDTIPEAALFTDDPVGQTKLTPNLSGNVTNGQLRFSATAPGYNITGTGASILYLSPAASFGGVGIIITNGAANQTISAAEVYFLTNQTWDIEGTTILTVSGTIEDAPSPDYALTKNGTGTLVFPGDVRYDGPTTNNAGTLILSFSNTSMLSACTVKGGILRATTSANALGNNATRNTITLTGGALELANNTGLTFGPSSRNTTVTGSTTIRSDRLSAGAGVTHTLGTLNINGSTLNVTAGGNVTSGTAVTTFGATTLSGNATLNVTNNGSANAQLTLGAVGESGGARSLTKTGNGTLFLNGAGSYTGGTTLSQGAITLGVANGLGSGGFNFAGGALNANNTTDSTIGALTLSTNSTLNLSPGGAAATLTFAGVSGAANGILTITGWSGSVGGLGTNDKIIFSGGTAPDADFLQHIQFDLGDGNVHVGALGAGGELFPSATSGSAGQLVLTNFSAAHPIRVMYIGDSVTDDCVHQDAWRFELEKVLRTNSFPFRSVGRQLSPTTGGFTNRQHEGYCGAVIAAPGTKNTTVYGYVPPNLYLDKVIADALASPEGSGTNTPDLFCVYIGINDIGWAREPHFLATNDMPGFLDLLFSNAPNASVILVKTSTIRGTPAHNGMYGTNAPNIPIYGGALQAMVNQRRSQGQGVFLADMFSTLDYDTMFDADHEHPNPTGLAAVAREFATRIEAITIRTNRLTTTLIYGGSDWKYSDTGANLGTNWTQSNYDDSAWSHGVARLGYGDATVATPVSFGPDPNNKRITTYFRRQFVVPADTGISNLDFRLLRVDGAVVWLNGKELFRNNIHPTGPVIYGDLASSRVTNDAAYTFFQTNVVVPPLSPGTNIVTVELHLSSITNSMLGFDMELLGTGARLSTGVPVLVPDLVGQVQAAAQTNIVAAGLTVGAVTTSSSMAVPAGNVISQNPSGGTSVSLATAVDLVVSTGPPVTVPDVVSLTQSNATNAIVAASLAVGTVAVAPSSTVQVGAVISQLPASGTLVPPGSAVSLVISTGPATNIQLSNFQTAVTNGDAISYSMPYTVPNIPGENLVLVVYGGGEDQSQVMPTNASFNGNTMTLAGAIRTPAAGVSAGTGLFWKPVAPGESGTITMTFSLQIDECALAAVTLVGANTNGPNAVETSTATANITDSITTTAVNDLVISAATMGNANALTPTGTGHVDDVSIMEESSWFAGGHREVVSPATVSLGFSGSPINRIAMVLAVFPVGVPSQPPVTVPAVVGLAQSVAETNLVAANLSVGTISNASSATVAPGIVLGQNPAAGASVPSGTTVSLLVSTGPSVPNVVNLTETSATNAIISAGLSVGLISHAPHGIVPAGSVISQNPVAGTSVTNGAAVNLVVSTGATIPVVNDPVYHDGVFQLSVPTLSGKLYILEFTDQFPATNWTDVQSVSGDNSVRVLTDSSATNSQRYYRVRME